MDGGADEVVTLTFGELVEKANDAARAFIAAGIEPGDRVAIWAPNTWEWVVALHGLQAAGAVLVPLNTRYKGTEAAHILGSSRARLLLTVEGFLGNDYVSMLRRAEEPDGSLEHLERIVVLRGEVPDGCVTWTDFLAAGDVVEPAEVDRRVDALGEGDLADLLFTSGTTGAPKGVMCTHGQTTRAYEAWASTVGLREDDRYLVVNPFFHSFGYKAGIVASLLVGATIYPEAVFDVPKVIASIAEHRITALPGPPALYQSIINHPDLDVAALESLRLAVTGAAVVPVELIGQMSEVLGFDTVLTAYGLTEACGVVTVSDHDADRDTIANFCGRAIPGVELATFDESGSPTRRMEPGEVVVRGFNVMLGYFEDPERTAEAIDAEGWLHTGDIGVLDERGYLRITDRAKDMFIVGGFNAYPAEIESLMLEHPSVAQVAVVGVPDERMGEVGYAFVVPTPDALPTPLDLIDWAREHMANFKAPRHVELVETLPLNASGKVLKNELREQALAAVTNEGDG